MARHRQPPNADCRHGIDHPHCHARHETGRACDEKAGCNIELIIFEIEGLLPPVSRLYRKEKTHLA